MFGLFAIPLIRNINGTQPLLTTRYRYSALRNLGGGGIREIKMMTKCCKDIKTTTQLRKVGTPTMASDFATVGSGIVWLHGKIHRG